MRRPHPPRRLSGPAARFLGHVLAPGGVEEGGRGGGAEGVWVVVGEAGVI